MNQARRLRYGFKPMLKRSPRNTTSGDTESAFSRMCAKHGTTPEQALRNIVHKIVHGVSYDELQARK